MRRTTLILLLVFVLIGTTLFAGTTGKLVGKVKDSNGKPLAFAAVMIKGTQIGALTKQNGQFIIINIPPGKYTVVCRLIGYSDREAEVTINMDETSTLNIKMFKKSLKMKAFKVIKQKEDLIKKDKVGSSQNISSDNISNLAVTDISDIIATKAGTVKSSDGELHIRGGRANEVVYSVDGMSVSDPVDGGAALSLDTDAIAEMSVMTGGFTAEYGNAQSGIVNIITKSGGKNYSGKIELNSDHIFDDNGSNSDVAKFAIGGPVLGGLSENLRNRFTFYLNGAGNWYDTRYKDNYKNDPNKELKYLTNTYSPYNAYDGRKDFLGFDLGNRNVNNYNANLKIRYDLTATKKFTLALRGSKKDQNPYSQYWKYALEHYVHTDNSQQQIIGTYDYLINSQMNIKVKASYFQTKTKYTPRGIQLSSFFVKDANYYNESHQGIKYLDENDDGVIDDGYLPASEWQYQINGVAQPVGLGYFAPPGSFYSNFVNDKSTQTSVKADYEYQINQIHGLKTGFEIIKHHIKKDRILNPNHVDALRYDSYLQTCTAIDSVYNENLDVMVPIYSLDDRYDATVKSSGETDGYKADPYQGAYYLQDKMEYEDLIVNMGIRFDFWYLGTGYDIKQDDGSYEKYTFDKKDRLRVMVSPRLGVSHPISDKDVIHFAYNYQNQLPQMQYIFTTKKPEDAIVSDNAIVVGNPKLDPQITVTYEVGLQHQLGESWALDVTSYYKNIYNYVSTKKVTDPNDETISWYEYISEDYGSGRGVDMNLQGAFSNFLSGTFSYSLAWANGNNSATVIQDESTNLREFPLDWDVRNNFSTSLQFRVKDGEEWFIPFTDTIFPLDDFMVNFMYSYSSGRPYTPQTSEGHELETNSELMPHTENADMKISKSIKFGSKKRYKLYCTINNLFNKRNVNYVYPKTGKPDDDGADITSANSDYVFAETAYLHSLSVKNPGNWSTPRTIILGMSFSW